MTGLDSCAVCRDFRAEPDPEVPVDLVVTVHDCFTSRRMWRFALCDECADTGLNLNALLTDANLVQP